MVDTPEDMQIMTVSVEDIQNAGMPGVLPAGNLSATRQEYLYKESIRPHVPVLYQDELCPKPHAQTLQAEEAAELGFFSLYNRVLSNFKGVYSS